jgi:hypothetical protein
MPSTTRYAHDAFVAQIKSKEELEECGYFTNALIRDNPNIYEKYLIVDTPEPHIFVAVLNGKYYNAYSYLFRQETKMSIEEAKKKMPQLFI